MIQRLVPKVFFDTLGEGLDLFVDCLGFRVAYQDESLAVVERDGAKAYVVASPEYAAKDRPEIALETDSIYELYSEIKARRPEMLHPNSNQVRRKPWGPLEFAVLDKSTVCIVFRQWPQ
jgi:hypothetical protein